MVRGTGFRGALNYAMAPNKHAQIVGGNLDGKNPKELASEFAVSRALRPDCTRPVWHCSLSSPEGEKPSAEQWGQAAKLLLQSAGMNPEKHQYVAVRHGDAVHDHVHIYASRVGLDGSIWHGQHEASLVQDATDRIEHDLGLAITRNRRNPRFIPQPTVKCTKQETEMWRRKGVEIPPKFLIAASIDEALKKAKSWEDLTAALSISGIELKRNERGVGYRLNYLEPTTGEECSYKASDIGKSYSFKNVARRLEENINGQDRPNEISGQGGSWERPFERDYPRSNSDQSTPRRGPDGHTDTDATGAAGTGALTDSRAATEAYAAGQHDNRGHSAGRNLGMAGTSSQALGRESSELGHGRAKFSENASGNKRMDPEKPIHELVEEVGMERELVRSKVQETIEQILAEQDQIETKRFVQELGKWDVEAKLFYNDKLRRIMGFGLDCDGEHFQGHEVGIPWSSIREKLILSDGIKKVDREPIHISPSSPGGEIVVKRSRTEAFEAAKRRCPELFADIQFGEEDEWALFTSITSVDGDGETETVEFYESPSGKEVQINQNTYQAISAALIYGHERWEGPVAVRCKTPEIAKLFLQAADDHGVPISNREELERLATGLASYPVAEISRPSGSGSGTPTSVVFTDYAQTLEKLIEFEGFVECDENESKKADLRAKLDAMVQQGVQADPNPKVMDAFIESEVGKIECIEQAEALQQYLMKIGYETNLDDLYSHMPSMGY